MDKKSPAERTIMGLRIDTATRIWKTPPPPRRTLAARRTFPLRFLRVQDLPQQP